MIEWPDSLLLRLFSCVDWRSRLKFESVCKRWNRVLLDRTLGIVQKMDLDTLTKDHSELPEIIHSLVGKPKILTEVYSRGIDIQALLPIIETLVLSQPGHLTVLQIISGPTGLVMPPEFSRLLGLFTNLEVLKLSLYSTDIDCQPIDLDGLVLLKELVGKNVKFNNCRAPSLAQLKYQNVFLDGLDDYVDFVEMVGAAAGQIECLDLCHVFGTELLDDESADQFADCKLPNLKELKLRGVSLWRMCLDLSESTNLRCVDVCSSKCRIINFDLSIHCLERFNVSYDGSAITNQFIASAMRPGARLFFLEHLSVFIGYPKLVELVVCLLSARCHSFAVEYFEVRSETIGEVLQDLSDFEALVKRCPGLRYAFFHGFSVDKRCLIDFITAIIPHGVELYVKFGRLMSDSICDFVCELHNSLCSIDLNRFCSDGQNKISINLSNVCSDNFDNELRDAIEGLSSFGVTICD